MTDYREAGCNVCFSSKTSCSIYKVQFCIIHDNREAGCNTWPPSPLEPGTGDTFPASYHLKVGQEWHICKFEAMPCERCSWNHDWCWKTTLRLHSGSPTFKDIEEGYEKWHLEINNMWKVCDSLAVRWAVPKDIGNSQEGFLWHLNIPPVPLGEIRSVNIIILFKRRAYY